MPRRPPSAECRRRRPLDVVSRPARRSHARAAGRGIERERRRSARAASRRRVELGDRPGPRRRPADRLRAPALRRAPRTSSGGGSISSVNGIARFCMTRQRLEQHRALADDAEAIDDGQPVGAVGDRAGRPAEQLDVAAIGQRRAGDEVDEHFRRSADRSRAARRARRRATRSCCDPQRAEAAVVLRDAGELEDRRRVTSRSG